MPALHDLRCDKGHELRDVAVAAGCYPACSICNTPMRPDFSRWRGIATDCWGAPRYIESLDQTFSSRSELKSHLKANGLIEAGDKVHGARNEDHLRHKSRPLYFDRAGIGQSRSSGGANTQGDQ